MTEDQKARFIQAIEEGWNRGNMDAWDEFYAADYTHHRYPMGDFTSLKAEKESVRGTLSAFSNSKISVHGIVGSFQNAQEGREDN